MDFLIENNYNKYSILSLLDPAAGGSDDWVKGVVGVKYCYTIELRDTGRYGFLLPVQQIIPTGKETFEGFKHVMLKVKDTYGKTQ